MFTIGVWQGKRGLLMRSLSHYFTDGICISRPPECDICVSDGPIPDIFSPCRCQVAVLPGDNPINCCYLQAERVVTYGLSDRNTVALSSAGENGLLLALQREIVGLDGRRIGQRELIVRGAALTNSALAGATARLVCGGTENSLS